MGIAARRSRCFASAVKCVGFACTKDPAHFNSLTVAGKNRGIGVSGLKTAEIQPKGARTMVSDHETASGANTTPDRKNVGNDLHQFAGEHGALVCRRTSRRSVQVCGKQSRRHLSTATSSWPCLITTARILSCFLAAVFPTGGSMRMPGKGSRCLPRTGGYGGRVPKAYLSLGFCLSAAINFASSSAISRSNVARRSGSVSSASFFR